MKMGPYIHVTSIEDVPLHEGKWLVSSSIQ